MKKPKTTERPNPGFYGAAVRSLQMRPYLECSEWSYQKASTDRAMEIKKLSYYNDTLARKEKNLAEYQGSGTFCFRSLAGKEE